MGWVHGLSKDYPPKLVNFIIVTTNLTVLLPVFLADRKQMMFTSQPNTSVATANRI